MQQFDSTALVRRQTMMSAARKPFWRLFDIGQTLFLPLWPKPYSTARKAPASRQRMPAVAPQMVRPRQVISK